MDAASEERLENRRRWAARAALAELRTVLGGPGLTVARRSPGLLAAVDQHAAAIRDALGALGTGPGPIALAGYADGLRDAAREYGWSLPTAAEVDWSDPPWPVLRLLAVCALAEP